MDTKTKIAACATVDACADNFRKELTRIAGLIAPAAANAQHHMATREFSLAVTKIDEAVLWARQGIMK